MDSEKDLIESQKVIAEKILARQPILNRKQNTVGYELLFRESQDKNLFTNKVSGDVATLTVINSLITVGLHNVIGSNKAFINFDTDLLLDQYYKLLPKDAVVIEILENVKISDRLVKVCKEAKEEGFMLALDDFFFRERIEQLIELADIIKIDMIESSEEEIVKYAEEFKKRGKFLLAEKVETDEEFNNTLRMGFDYFQGFFFSRPQIISGHDIPVYKAKLLKLMQEVQMGADLEKMIELIGQDVALSWKLLKFINSAFFGFRSHIGTVKRAAYMLGEKELKRWMQFIIISEIATDSPLELVSQSAFRGKFAECITEKIGGDELPLKAFTAGMFSLMDAILQKPIHEILDDISLDEEIKNGILRKDTFLGNIIQLVVSREEMDFPRVNNLLQTLNFSYADLQQAYFNAITWTTNLFSSYK